MSSPTQRFGLSVAIATPFTADGAIDHNLLLAHAKDLLARGADLITLFGTTGEGPSVGGADRRAAFRALIQGGIPASKLVAGVMTSTMDETIGWSREALELGCRAVMIAPPFYFKDVPEDGVALWFESVFRGIGPMGRDVILYHIPQFTGVPISPELVTRLRKSHPQVVAGFKDSAGVWARTEALLAAHNDLLIMVGDETQVAAAVRKGGAGTICGFANVIPEAMRRVVHLGTEQPEVDCLAAVLKDHHFLGALKALLAHRTGAEGWRNLRPPLVALPAADRLRLIAAYETTFGSRAA